MSKTAITAHPRILDVDATPAQPHRRTGTTVTFIDPMPGSNDDATFTLNPIDRTGIFTSLQSTRDTNLRFIITSVETCLSDYHTWLTPILAAAVPKTLAAQPAEPAIDLYVLVTIGETPDETTVNLRAPLAINPAARTAVQVVFDDDTLPVHQPLSIRPRIPDRAAADASPVALPGHQ